MGEDRGVTVCENKEIRRGIYERRNVGTGIGDLL